jgi:ribosomal protein S18 acetylase RimI-like enzyme
MTIGERQDIRVLARAELRDVVSLHLRAFQTFYLSALGPRFLSEYYRCLLDYGGGIALRIGPRGEVRGFVAGFANPPEFYRAVRRRALRMGIAAIPAILSQPRLGRRLFANYYRTRRLATTSPQGASAELASLAVAPAHEGKGLGQSLVRAFCREAASRGVRNVRLTTDADKNDRANNFYILLGFKLARSFEVYGGRRLNEYWISTDCLPPDYAN